MAIWLGEAGGLRLARTASRRVYANIQPSDVDVNGNRFGFDRATTSLVTGDLVWFRRVDASGNPVANELDFVAASGWPDNKRHSDGRWYVHVDPVGGIRLFKSWADALRNSPADAVLLTAPSSTYRISLEIEDSNADCLAQTISWELNTNRNVADITSLGEGFQKQMGTLVSGSGSVTCFFDTNARDCDDFHEGTSNETALYLHQLVLRQEIGSTFKGVFLLKQANALPISALLSLTELRRELFYLCDCVITEVAVALEPGEAIRSKINFVTTGPVQLLYDFPRGYLLQEQPPQDKILQETGLGILLEVPN